LSQIPVDSDVDHRALSFVDSELCPMARSVASAALVHAAQHGLARDSVLLTAERCLSPSDFGYHNVLLEPGGAIRFIDFEYAGWDDPAKLVCDFFHQVQVPVSRSHYNDVVDAVARTFGNEDRLRRRIECLMPVYAVKWCCIVLNEFL